MEVYVQIEEKFRRKLYSSQQQPNALNNNKTTTTTTSNATICYKIIQSPRKVLCIGLRVLCASSCIKLLLIGLYMRCDPVLFLKFLKNF
ncbi:transmembrane protein, putative (macronuclear) [Tetrahymena thermophila SB210]|uniref:Transmembrane protein, putative n=1 Tax=Tetrahymena thermophila (strain SB210) TaxID=312017 RepID=I7M3E5_TETTS|nr:transmembrane protein, putative [Tetrahymena thermophila SB210]EAS02993.1 transmembrane protein, putative [Tetrahymena thermophila SB210]|eukprot:XP_001023238.1 transmembrane protein, putative [Tetrahymena thermophila SB210]